MRATGWMLASSAVLGAVLSCRGPASSSSDASPPEVASEFRGVALAPATSGSATSAGVRDGGPDSADAALQHCLINGLDPAMAQTLEVQLEAKVNAGTATDREIKTLMGLCVCLDDKPCVEWANVVDSQGWRAPDGAVVKIVR
jgi:hypothetical protein